MANPVLTMTRYNVKGDKKANTLFSGINDTQASSERVQFNVVMDAAEGCVYVGKDNPGMCIITIDPEHVLTRAWYEIVQDGSYTEDDPDDPHAIDNTINVDPRILGNHTAQFEVSLKNRASTKRGNVTMTFFVAYRKG